jgi:hypothetical protein
MRRFQLNQQLTTLVSIATTLGGNDQEHPRWRKVEALEKELEQKQAKLDTFSSRKKQRMDPLITGVLNSVRSATGMLSAGDSTPSVVNTGSVSIANSSVTHTGGSRLSLEERNARLSRSDQQQVLIAAGDASSGEDESPDVRPALFTTTTPALGGGSSEIDSD